jgi:hypothetical protein
MMRVIAFACALIGIAVTNAAVSTRLDRAIGCDGRHAVLAGTAHAMAGVTKLPMQDIKDQSLVYPTVEKR